MGDNDDATSVHDLDVTLWVGKAGIDPAIEELATQLEHTGRVKVRVLRQARAHDSVEEIAEQLAESTNARVIDVRGHTAVIGR